VKEAAREWGEAGCGVAGEVCCSGAAVLCAAACCPVWCETDGVGYLWLEVFSMRLGLVVLVWVSSLRGLFMSPFFLIFCVHGRVLFSRLVSGVPLV